MSNIYYTAKGERLVTQGSRSHAPVSDMHTMRLNRARRLLQCSVCEAPVRSISQLDASLRCVECQP